MTVDVSQLLDNLGETQKIAVPYEIHIMETDYVLQSPVQLDLLLVSTGESILVQGKITGTIEATCSRCLKVFNKYFSIAVEEEYKKMSDVMSVSEKDKELGLEDFVYTIGTEGQIELSELVRQNIVVNMPLTFICEDSCQGLQDKGLYAEKKTDPRFEKLKGLK